jgi:hypothetical protein
MPCPSNAGTRPYLAFFALCKRLRLVGDVGACDVVLALALKVAVTFGTREWVLVPVRAMTALSKTEFLL